MRCEECTPTRETASTVVDMGVKHTQGVSGPPSSLQAQGALSRRIRISASRGFPLAAPSRARAMDYIIRHKPHTASTLIDD